MIFWTKERLNPENYDYWRCYSLEVCQENKKHPDIDVINDLFNKIMSCIKLYGDVEIDNNVKFDEVERRNSPYRVIPLSKDNILFYVICGLTALGERFNMRVMIFIKPKETNAEKTKD